VLEELTHVLDDLGELVRPIAVLACELDELSRACDDRASLRSAGDGDAAASPEFEQPLVSEHSQRSEHGVRVDAEYGGEVFCRGEALSGLRLAVCDRTPDFASDLFVQVGRICLVDLDIQHGASHSSATVDGMHV